MQRNSRERRSHSRTRKLRGITYASITLILFSSCSLFSKDNTIPKNKFKDLKEFSEKVCLNSIGRGRIEMSGEKNRFTYEATIKKELFWLGIDVPFKGQETLGLPLVDSKNGKGTLYKKITQDLLERRKIVDLRNFVSFLTTTGKFLREIRDIRDGKCTQLSCLSTTINIGEGMAEFTARSSGSPSIKIIFSRLRDGQYTSMKMHTESKNSKSPSISIHLITTECN